MQQAAISFPMFGEGFLINPSPVVFELSGFKIYWYGVIIALGFLFATIYCTRRCKEFGIQSDDFLDVLLWAIPLGVVGARLYYVIFNFQIFSNDLLSILNTRTGGLAIYGGIIGGAIALLLVCRRKKIPAGPMLDTISFGLLIGQGIGRWGNFINREVFGTETNIFCRMGLTYPDTETIYVHPLFLYESIWNLVGFLCLHIYSKKKKPHFDGQLFLMYVAWYGFGRMLLEGMRMTEHSLFLGNTGIRVSQLLAGLSMLLALLLIYFLIRRQKKTNTVLWRNHPTVIGNLEISETHTTHLASQDNASESTESQKTEDTNATDN